MIGESDIPCNPRVLIMRPQYLVAILLACIVLCAMTIPAPAQSKPEPPVATLRQKVLDAKRWQESQDARRALLQRVGPAGLTDLTKDEDTGIALLASWEQVRLTVPDKESDQRTPVDARKLAWFLGFLEGRARVELPPWWAETVRGCGAYGRDSIRPEMPRFNRPYDRVGLGSARGPRGTTLERDTTRAYSPPKVVLRLGKESALVPEPLLDPSGSVPKQVVGRLNADDSIGNVSALIKGDRCYLAVHEDSPHSYRVFRIDRRNGEVTWTSDVWGHAPGIFGGRPGPMYVTVTDQGGRVVLFGASGAGFHIEAFRADDGKNLFRFSSSYSGE